MRRSILLLVAVLVLKVQLGARLDQQADSVELPLEHRGHDRSSPVGVSCVEGGPGGEQLTQAAQVAKQALVKVARQQAQADQAQLKLREVTFQRQQPLAGDAVSREQLDEAKAQLDVARSVLRRAERRIVGSKDDEDLAGSVVLPYVNRLSDLLFAMARFADEPQPKLFEGRERAAER